MKVKVKGPCSAEKTLLRWCWVKQVWLLLGVKFMSTNCFTFLRFSFFFFLIKPGYWGFTVFQTHHFFYSCYSGHWGAMQPAVNTFSRARYKAVDDEFVSQQWLLKTSGRLGATLAFILSCVPICLMNINQIYTPFWFNLCFGLHRYLFRPLFGAGRVVKNKFVELAGWKQHWWKHLALNKTRKVLAVKPRQWVETC